VKESINKLKLLQPLKSQNGTTTKVPKVELTISVNGVALQEPKTKKIFCQFPLHRISYCADDKAEKKYFSFIAKDGETGKQLCFVFMSEKMSEEIILTIGQAFDLAYAKFIENSGKELEIRKQLILLQKKVNELEDENLGLRKHIQKYEPEFPLERPEAEKKKNNSTDKKQPQDKAEEGSDEKKEAPREKIIPALQPPPPVVKKIVNNNNNEPLTLLDCDIELDDKTQTIINRNNHSNSIHDLLDQEFDPRAPEASLPVPIMASLTAKSENDLSSSTAAITQEKDIFGSEPFQKDTNTRTLPTPPLPVVSEAEKKTGNGLSTDPFGMSNFMSSNDLDSAMISLDKKFAEMRVSLHLT